MSRRTIAKGAFEEQFGPVLQWREKPINSLAKCIRIWRKLDAFLDGIYRPLSPLDSIFAGISRNFAGFFSRLQRLFFEINISEAF